MLGEEHLFTLKSMADLANTYHYQGKWIEAEHLQIQVMDMRKKLLGPEHPDTLTNMANIAATYYKQGKQIEAEQLIVEFMNIEKRMGIA